MSPEMLAGTGILRGVIAAVLLVAFLALWASAFSSRRRATFQKIAQLPLEDDDYRAGPERGTLK
jgi:cbb3-type cytochrome oxidase subunit 3